MAGQCCRQTHLPFLISFTFSSAKLSCTAMSSSQGQAHHSQGSKNIMCTHASQGGCQVQAQVHIAACVEMHCSAVSVTLLQQRHFSACYALPLGITREVVLGGTCCCLSILLKSQPGGTCIDRIAAAAWSRGPMSKACVATCLGDGQSHMSRHAHS